MSIERALALLLICGAALANNGRELSPNGLPFAKLVGVRTDESGAKRRGVCSGTFVKHRGRAALITAAHCLTPPWEVARFRVEHGALTAKARYENVAHPLVQTWFDELK